MVKLEVITLEGVVKQAEGFEVVIPGAEGQLGVRAGHIPIITPLLPGEAVIKKDNGTEEVVAIFGGFAEIKDNVISVMADSAENADTIDEKTVQEAIARAESNIPATPDEAETRRALAALSANIARLKAVRRLHRK
jgi:F-type H+-transporting ATPase subunit epsilon